MTRTVYKYPPRPSSGSGTFSDDIVGLQLTTGGGLTQGNFEFTTAVVEKVNRNFNIGAFSEPISLDTLNIGNILESKLILAKDYRVYPNFDLSEVSRFTLYGPLTNRMSASIRKIINFFPGALEISPIKYDATSGYTAENCVYDQTEDVTTFTIPVAKIMNPFGVDFSVNSTRNISLLEYEVSPLRNMSAEYLKYSLFVGENEYPLKYLNPTQSLTSGNLEIIVAGNPFSGYSVVSAYLIVRPSSYYSDKALLEPFDEVEKFLLNRLVSPQYTATFQVPKQTEDGQFYVDYETVTWPLNGLWNLDISTVAFDTYISTISDVADSFDSFRSNLVTRFLTTQSFKEFDTSDQRIQKVLNIYGRSFDEVKKFIDALAFMNSVNYTVKNDIPSELLKNLADTIGWKVNISPITSDDFLTSVFGNSAKTPYPGYSRANTPTELNYQYYRNLILNSAYLFKSKGTRKSIEALLRLVGAPEALVEFNEHIYIAGQRISMSDFDSKYTNISGGTHIEHIPVYDSETTFSILGTPFTGFTGQIVATDANAVRGDYPVDDDGFPKSVNDSSGYFFQKGAGWFELVTAHQSPQEVNKAASTFTGQNFNIQTSFEPFTYGQKYLERYRKFPYMSEGFRLVRTIDNRKSWPSNDVGLRIGGRDSEYNAYYYIQNDKYALNVKNIELFLNPAQGLVYDVWYMSNKYDYPIPSTGLTTPYPQPGGVDWTYINPKPTKKTFFEFAQTFWYSMINARNRQFISDGKTGGYPTLQSIWWKYLDSGTAINVPNDNFTYQAMINYINGLGDYWVRLVEQMIPATTIWLSGYRYENSIFHRQKFVYRLQRGCEIVPVPCDPCVISGNIFPYLCVDETARCYLYPWDDPIYETPVTSFTSMLYQVLLAYLNSISVSISDCILDSLRSEWYVDVRIDGVTILQQHFYSGMGINDAPSNALWQYYVETYMPAALLIQGLGFSLVDEVNGPLIVISNLNCDPYFYDKTFELNVGINLSINCN